MRRTILIGVDRDVGPDDAETMRARLEEQLPGYRVIVVVGMTSSKVISPVGPEVEER